MSNDFQFLDLPRQNPDKVPALERSKMNPSRRRHSRSAVWTAVTPIVNGSALCIISFQIG